MAGLAIRDPRAITDRPYPWVVGYLKVLVHHDPAGLFFAREGCDKRVWTRWDGTDQRLGGDPFPSVQEGILGSRPRKAGVEMNLHSPSLK